MAFAILRVGALKSASRGKGSLGGALRHLDNHKDAADISRPEMTQFNRSFMNTEPTYKEAKARAQAFEVEHNKAVDDWNATHEKPKKRHFREGANQFFEAVFTYSPEAEGRINRDAWAHEVIDFIKKEFLSRGSVPLRCKLDCDEQTCHIHFIGLSWNRDTKQTGLNSTLGSRKDLSELQDRYADTLEGFGLERGYSRYNAYETIRRRALAQGYKDTPEDVKAFADANGLDVPKYRGHKPVGVYKAEIHKKGLALEREIDIKTRTLKDLEAIKQDIINESLIPEHYFETVQKCETYERLLKVGKDIQIDSEDGRTTLTDYLIEQTNKDLGRLKNLDLDISR